MAKVNITDIIGKKFGWLQIINETKIVKNNKSIRAFTVKCDCGEIAIKNIYDVLSGKVKSCGCKRKFETRKRNTTHGLSRHPLWHIWLQMLGRCKNKRNKNYHNYGERGIKVCKVWEKDFKIFYDWCNENGYKKGLQLDRYPDNDGDYKPENCRWTTQLKNKQNTRKNVYVEYNGETKCVAEWARQFGVGHKSIAARWKAGVRGDLLFSKKRFYFRENTRYAHRVK